jgi:hypothetical protein
MTRVTAVAGAAPFISKVKSPDGGNFEHISAHSRFGTRRGSKNFA